MDTYWNDFLEVYGIKLHKTNLPLAKVLEAFWYYSQINSKNRIENCERVLNGERVK